MSDPAPTTTAPIEHDFRIDNHGSIALLTPRNNGAAEWMRDNLATEPWQMFGNATAIEPRCVPDIVEGLIEEGFLVDLSA